MNGAETNAREEVIFSKNETESKIVPISVRNENGNLIINCNLSNFSNVESVIHRDRNAVCSFENCLLKTRLNGYNNLLSIISINLTGCDLQELPDCFSELHLKELHVPHNKFVTVPDCVINSLRNLEVLDLSYNFLENFDAEPKCVQKLRYLNVEHNRINNVPEWILQVCSFNLEEFYYSYNSISSFNSSAFHRVSYYELKRLAMRNCRLINQDFKFLKDIRTLQYLDISNDANVGALNCFTNCDILFENAAWCECLTTLKLNNLELSIIPNEICSLLSLAELELSKNCLIWLPGTICELKNLKTLDISYNKVGGFPKEFDRLTKLEVLKASFNNIYVIEGIDRMSSLRYLDLYMNDFDSFDFDLDGIEFLDLEQNFVDTDTLAIKNYKQKRDSLRVESKTEKRLNGPRQAEESPDYSDNECKSSDMESSSECSYDCNKDCVRSFNNSFDMESWDEDRIVFSDNECTLSDNEWKGNDVDVASSKVNSQRKKSAVMPRWPSYLFEDAVE